MCVCVSLLSGWFTMTPSISVNVIMSFKCSVQPCMTLQHYKAYPQHAQAAHMLKVTFNFHQVFETLKHFMIHKTKKWHQKKEEKNSISLLCLKE